MVYTSLDELVPTAEEYGEHHVAIGGVMAEMVVMASYCCMPELTRT
jgi:ZIP family zinc transporter